MSTFSTQQKLELADALRSYYEDSKATAEAQGQKFSQNDFAAKLGLSSGVVGYIFDPEKHNILNNQKNPILTDRVWKRVQRFLQIDQHIWETENYDQCWTAFMECKLNAEQRIIDGSTGMGKTFPAVQFVKKYPANTFLVTCATDQNPKQFMYEFAKAVGVKESELGGSRYDLRIKICERLMDLQNPHVIIDEAENARPSVIGALKDIYDYKSLYNTVGMTILGANGFVDSLRKKAQRKVKHAYPQFLRRFGADPVYLTDYNKKEADGICRLYDMDASVRNYIVNAADNLGHLSSLIKRYLADTDLFVTERINNRIHPAA